MSDDSYRSFAQGVYDDIAANGLGGAGGILGTISLREYTDRRDSDRRVRLNIAWLQAEGTRRDMALVLGQRRVPWRVYVAALRSWRRS